MNDTWTEVISDGRRVSYSCQELNKTTCNVTAQPEGSEVLVQKLVPRTANRKEVEHSFSAEDFG